MKVFLSYSRKDEAFVTRLAADLERHHIDPWLDVEDLPTSDEGPWRRSIAKAIDESAALVVVLSPDSVTSEPVEREVTIAAEAKRRIIPIVHRPCQMSHALQFELAGVQRIDFSTLPYDKALDQLVGRIGPVTPPGPALTPTPDATLDRPLDRPLDPPPPPPPPPPPSADPSADPARRRTRVVAAAGAGALLAVGIGVLAASRQSGGSPPVEIATLRATCSADDCAAAPIGFSLGSGEPGTAVAVQVTWPDGDRGDDEQLQLDGSGALPWTWTATPSHPIGEYHVSFGFADGDAVERAFVVEPVAGPFGIVQRTAAALIAGDWSAAADLDGRLGEADEAAVVQSYEDYEVRRWIPTDATGTSSAAGTVMTGAFVGYDDEDDTTGIDCELWTAADGGDAMRSEPLAPPSGEPSHLDLPGRVPMSDLERIVADHCGTGSFGASVEPVEPAEPTTTIGEPSGNVLEFGVRDPSVTELQNLLNDANYDAGSADGIFGARTRAALEQFEHDLGRAVDGRIEVDGPEWTELERLAASGQCRLELVEPDIGSHPAGTPTATEAELATRCTKDADLLVDQVTVETPGESASAVACGQPMSEGDPCLVRIDFTPTDGEFEIELTVHHDGAGPATFTLTGRGTGGGRPSSCSLDRDVHLDDHTGGGRLTRRRRHLHRPVTGDQRDDDIP